VPEEDVRHEFAPAAEAEVPEQGLQVILHSAGREVERMRDLRRRQAPDHERRDLALAL
jgi:hypothetical protein